MSDQDVCGHDFMQREQIKDSCRAIKRHASFIGVASSEVHSMPDFTVPGCMDELNEAEGVLKRALARIEQSKEVLLSKVPHQQAAE